MVTKINCTVPDYLVRQLDSIVTITGISSRSDAIRQAVRDYIKNQVEEIDFTSIINDIAEGKLPKFLLEHGDDINFNTIKAAQQIERLLKNIKKE